ncbi:MAG: tyrosine-type recombinase/integrase [Firmicutes bacterium]|nr:tyrosine-type recombinase/integrase [Bacillota bacterium]
MLQPSYRLKEPNRYSDTHLVLPINLRNCDEDPSLVHYNSRIETGALFCHVTKGREIGTTHLSDKTVARIVKKYVERIGLDKRYFAGHSLRAGLATSAAMAGASEREIMAQTGHKNPMMVRRYTRASNLFRSNAAARIGL